MTQNTEQHTRTREEIETELQRLFAHGVRGPNAAWQVVHRIFDEVRAYGAAEQRRKDAEDCAPRYQVWNTNPGFWDDCPEDEEDWRWEHATEADRRILYTRPANVAALEARIAELEKVLGDCVEVLSGKEPNTGYCCCGTEEYAHVGDMGHSYVDEGDYIRSNILGNARVALTRAGAPA